MAKKAVGPGYPVRAYDEEGNDVLPQEVQFKFSGGGIDLGDLAAPHVGRPVQGTWKGTVRGGGIVRDDSRVKLVYTVSVEDATIVEIPLEEVEGTLAHATTEVEKKGRQRKKGADVVQLPEAHPYTGEADGLCAVVGCGRPSSHPIHSDTGQDAVQELKESNADGSQE